jgi:cell division protein FtsI/penicillin-binding protein 2
MNNSRALLIILLMFAFFMVLVLTLFSIQITDHKMYAEMAERQQNKSYRVKGERGKILDRRNEVLAFTVNDVSLFVDTRMALKEEREKIAEKFSEVFGKDKNHYMDLMNSGLKNICLEKKVPKEKELMFKGFQAASFFIKEDFSRVYPYGSLLSHTLGYVDNECRGVNGTEKEFEEFLQGKDGVRHIENDSFGRTISVRDNLSIDPAAGKNIQLTIEKTYQKILEEELKSGIQKYGGESAVGIIMDPNSGEILALSNLPDYDPANYNLFADASRRNRSITDTYEPGSTIKPIILSMLINNNLADPSEIINTENGKYFIGNTKITDTHKHDYLSVKGILVESSNIGMAKLSDRISAEEFYKYLRAFGFGVKTGIDLPGETDGSLKKPNAYTTVSKGFISFGYEISSTPLQLITALSAVVNGGILYKPYITKRITDNVGNVISEKNPVKIRQIINSRTSDLLKELMVSSVEDGTGKNARMENVVIGGKTGTAQIFVDGSYSSEYYQSSFVGFLPIDKPKLICLIQISKPRIGKYGSMVAAPIFKSVMTRIAEADLDLVPEEHTINRDKMFVEKILNEIESDSKESFFTASNIGEAGDPVIDTSVRKTPSKMPDLTGLALRTALTTLNNYGIDYKVEGNGRVASQSILPGNSISDGEKVLLKCETKKSAQELKLN